MPSFVPVILCGGAGSRLWPISRESHPKPFLCLEDGLSLLQKTILRAAHLSDVNHIIVVTNEALFFSVQEAFQILNLKSLKVTYLLEPYPKNTAPAILSAALYLEKTESEDTTLLVLPADHLIENEISFNKSILHAKTLAEQDWVTTLGIEPNYPETGYGYIHMTKESISDSAFKVDRFVEKPSKEIAESYLASREYLWNAGIFCFNVRQFKKSIKKHCPLLLDALQDAQKSTQAIGQDIIVRFHEDAFSKAPSLSIDYALMEPLSYEGHVAVIPCDMAWNDVGSFQALDELSTRDEKGNALKGETLLHDTHNCYIDSPKRLTACVGLSNLIIVDTEDALLVADKSRAQEVKNIYETLKQNGHEAYKLHRTVLRPWGTYTVLETGDLFKIKRIEVKPGAKLSLQMHHYRSEHWIVVSGTAHVVNNEKTMTIHKNESTYIPAGAKHRLENKTEKPLIIIEVQSGSYLGEDDIVRFEDQYGRIEVIC